MTPSDLTSLAGLDCLERLGLANTSISDEDLDSLPDLPRLTELDLSLTPISDAGLEGLPQGWPSLRRLLLSGTAISDKGATRLAGLAKLESLDLAGTRISDAGLEALKNLSGLERLVLDHTAVSDGGLVHLRDLPALQYVSLTGTDVSDAGLQYLHELEGLKAVCVLGTRVSPEGVDDLKHRLPECIVEGDPRQAVDLLSLIVPSRDSVRGEWDTEADVLVSPDELDGLLQIRHTQPEQYGLELVAARRSGDDALIVGLVAGGRQVLLAIDTAAMTALGRVDGMPAHQTETAQAINVFTGPAPVRVLITVRKSHITVACGGRVLIDWRGDFNRLSLNPLWSVPDEKALFIGSFRSSFAISKLQLTPISGTGAVVIEPQAKSSKD